MEKIRKIGIDLFEYFLSIYPEGTNVSICISDKFFQKFLDKHSVTIHMIQKSFFTPNIYDSYECLTIAVYQSTMSVKKNVDQSCYNKELCQELSITISKLEKWYSDYQDLIWGKILKRLFENERRALLLPSPKKGKDRYVQYPALQFLISPQIIKNYKKTNLSFEEYSRRNFSSMKTYYDKNRLQKKDYYYKYSKDNLNFTAKRIIYSFVLNDIKFAINTKKKEPKQFPKSNKNETEKQLVLMIEKEQIKLYTLQDETIIQTSSIGKILFYLFTYDESNKFWVKCNSKKITQTNKYGILVAKSFIDNNESINDIINQYWEMCNYYFLEIKDTPEAINTMCNIFYLDNYSTSRLSFVGGFKNNEAYHSFCLPIITLAYKANTLFINDKDIKFSSAVYDLNNYKEYIKNGNNSFKTEVSEKYYKEIIIKKNPENLDYNLGWYVDDKNFSMTSKSNYHIQGVFLDDSIPQIQKKSKDQLLLKRMNPLYTILNKNLISQLNKGKINDL